MTTVKKFSLAKKLNKHMSTFISTLFSPEIIDESCKQQLLNGLSRTLSEDDRGLCEEPLSLVELTAFVKGLSLGKSPGADGLTVEFYCLF